MTSEQWEEEEVEDEGEEDEVDEIKYSFTDENPYLSDPNWNTKYMFQKLLKEWLQWDCHINRTFKLTNGIWWEYPQTLEITIFNDFLHLKRKRKTKTTSSSSKTILNKKKKNKKKKSNAELKRIETMKNVRRVLQKTRYYYILKYWDSVKEEIINTFKKKYPLVIKNYNIKKSVHRLELKMIHRETQFCKDTVYHILKHL